MTISRTTFPRTPACRRDRGRRGGCPLGSSQGRFALPVRSPRLPVDSMDRLRGPGRGFVGAVPGSAGNLQRALAAGCRDHNLAGRIAGEGRSLRDILAFHQHGISPQGGTVAHVDPVVHPTIHTEGAASWRGGVSGRPWPRPGRVRVTAPVPARVPPEPVSGAAALPPGPTPMTFPMTFPTAHGSPRVPTNSRWSVASSQIRTALWRRGARVPCAAPANSRGLLALAVAARWRGPPARGAGRWSRGELTSRAGLPTYVAYYPGYLRLSSETRRPRASTQSCIVTPVVHEGCDAQVAAIARAV